MSNDAAGNSIISYFQHPDGSLTYQSATASGGNGKDGGLGSQGSLVIDKEHQLLFAVNAGSNSVSSFKINENGSLTLAQTISSNGVFPISVTVHGNLLYVVNSTTSDTSGFSITSDGSMSLIAGSDQALSSANAGPAEILFAPDGKKLVVTEKNNNKITTFEVNASGIAYHRTDIASAGQTPFGFAFSGDHTIVVTEASGGSPHASTVSAYSVLSDTYVTDGPVHTQQTSACWATVSADGRLAYAANTSGNTISSFEVKR